MEGQANLKPLSSCLLSLGIYGDAHRAIMSIANEAARPASKVFQNRLERLGEIAGAFLEKSLQRRTFVGSAVDDIAWNVLLAIFEAQANGKVITVMSAAIASDAPSTTAIRHIRSLEMSGLLSRRNDWRDGRRSYLELTPVAFDQMADMIRGFCVAPPE